MLAVEKIKQICHLFAAEQEALLDNINAALYLAALLNKWFESKVLSYILLIGCIKKSLCDTAWHEICVKQTITN